MRTKKEEADYQRNEAQARLETMTNIIKEKTNQNEGLVRELE